MKLSFAFVVGGGALANVAMVCQAELMFRMHMNNGINDPAKSCQATGDNDWVNKVFEGPLIRRNLRAVDDVDQVGDRPSDSIKILEFDGRELSTVPEYCREACRGYVNDCRARGCEKYVGRGRRLQNYGKGFLSNSTLCNQVASSVNSDLNFLVRNNLVSTACKELIKAPRLVECYEDVLYGIIEKFSIINAETDSYMIPYLHARQTICGAAKLLTVGVEVSPCVESVNITLINKKAGFRETKLFDTTLPGPYTLFGMVGTSKTNFNGRRLPVGNYTLEATPDGFDYKMRDRMFYLDNC